MPTPQIGRSPPRKEARDKVTGRARYVDDVTEIAGQPLLFGATVRSDVPRGRIEAIYFDPRIPWDEFIVVTAKDIPGANVIALINDDQPCLADGLVRHAEEPVVLLAHKDRAMLEKGRAGVKLDIARLPAVLTIEESLAKKTIVWGDDNVFKEYWIKKGDVDAAFADPSVLVVEGEYETGAQEQLYIENNGMIAAFSKADGVTVWGSMQCPYYIQKALMKLFDVPPEKARVVQMETGGGFGGKEEYPSMIAAHAALLAMKAGRPVKIIYDRGEDMAATTKRHPSRTIHKTAVTREGKILAVEIDFVVDGGAYSTLSQVVLSRGCIHAVGPYDIPNVRVHARAVATSVPPHGAFRGFGAPQSIFAMERHLDAIAKVVGLTPVELRLRNFVVEGSKLATGQVVKDRVDMRKLLARALEDTAYDASRARFQKENEGSPLKRGMGIATFLHGTGFTGSGEKYLASVVGAELTKDGHVRILAASTEIGQGTNTIFAQIAADALGIDYEAIEIAQPDTGNVPNSGPTVASRTCTIVGKLVEQAVLDVKRVLVSSGALVEPYTTATFGAAVKVYLERFGPLRTKVQYEQPPHIRWDDATFVGDAYGAYSWAVYVAEVVVDTRTYEARVERFLALQEVGKVIHPLLAAGQIEGGVAQGIGWALYETCVWKDGRLTNNRMTDYIVPTAADVPPIHVVFEEVPYAYGPAGAKGIGELPMDGPAPAIFNAIEDAIGVSVRRVPATPETIMAAMEGAAS